MSEEWIISRLSGKEVTNIIYNLEDAGDQVLIGYDPTDDAFKFKVDGHWSPPLGIRDDGYGNAPANIPCRYCLRPLNDGESHLHGGAPNPPG